MLGTPTPSSRSGSGGVFAPVSPVRSSSGRGMAGVKAARRLRTKSASGHRRPRSSGGQAPSPPGGSMIGEGFGVDAASSARDGLPSRQSVASSTTSVRSAGPLERTLEEMEHDHMVRVAELEQQLVALLNENEECTRLLDQPAYGRTKLGRLVASIADLEDKLIKSSIEHEKLLQELLAKPSIFCDFAGEALSSVNKVINSVLNGIVTISEGRTVGGSDRADRRARGDREKAKTRRAPGTSAGDRPPPALMEGTQQLGALATKMRLRQDALKRINAAFKSKAHMHKDRNMHTKRMEALQTLNTSISRNQVKYKVRLHLYKRDVHTREKDIMLDVQQHQIAHQTLTRRKAHFERDKAAAIAANKQRREDVTALASHCDRVHKARVDTFDATLAEAIATQMQEKDENIAHMDKKVQQQAEEAAKRKGKISEQKALGEAHTKTLQAMAAESAAHEASVKDFRRTLQRTKKGLTAFRSETKKERLERGVAEEKAREEAEQARIEAENKEREIMDRRMEVQEDMLLNLNHKFPDEKSAIEFHLTAVRCIPPHGMSHWTSSSGLILDVKGLHLYNRAADEAFSIPYGGVHSWYGANYEKDWCFALPQKRVNEVGELKIMVRSKPTIQPDMMLLLQSDAAKSIHNYLCILFDKWEGMVKTREKWEVEEARKKGRK